MSTDTRTTTEQLNLEHVAHAYACFGAGDIEGMIAGYADDGVLVHHGPAAAATRGEWPKSELGLYLTTMGETVDLERFDLSGMMADGDRVVTLVDIAFTVRATGRRHEGPAVHVTTVRDGETVRHEIFTAEPESAYLT